MDPKRLQQYLIVLLGFLFFAVTQAYPAPGGLDTSFSQDGISNPVLANGGGSDYAYDSVIQPDGKIVVATRVQYGWRDACGVSRFNPNGTPDLTFDGDGSASIARETSFFCNAVALAPDGKIVVAGYSDSAVGQGAAHFAVARFNADGSVDNTLDDDGFVTTILSGSDDIATAVIVQPDGKIVAVGSTGPGGTEDFAAVRYLPGGQLDTTFDGDGKVITSITAGFDSCYNALLQPDGKIVAVGTIDQGTNDYGLVRWNTDGSLDATFGTGGKVTTNVGGHYDLPYGVALARDGKIVAAGYSYDGQYPRFSVARYNPDGSLDNTFSGDGKLLTPFFPASSDYGQSVVVQSDGKIIVAGYSGGGGSQLSAVRYTPDGTLDVTFGGDGTINRTFRDQTQIFSTNIQADGKVVFVGFAKDDFALGDAAIFRYNADGTQDSSFDGDGLVLSDHGMSVNAAEAIAIQSDGKIVAGGAVFNGRNSDFAIVRHLPNGLVDTTFGTAGVATTNFGVAYDSIAAIAVQSDGRIVAVGTTGGDVAIVRYNSDGSLDFPFGNLGTIVVTGGSSVNRANSVAIQADGKIVVGGAIANPSDTDFYLLRFNPDGSVDSTFGVNGVVTTRLFDAPGNCEVRSVIIQPDGKILAVGSAVLTSTRFAAVRYNPNGSRDVTFGGAGLLSIDMGGGGALAAALQPDGKIIFAGSNGGSSATGTFSLARTLPDGTLDQTFDGDGKVTTGPGMKATSVALQQDGKIVAAGYTGDGSGFGTGDMVLVRYNTNGSPDTSYGAGNGIVTLDLTNSFTDRINDVVVDGAGRAVTVGFAGGLFTVARFQGDLTPPAHAPFDFDGDGKTDLSIFRPAGGEWWYLKSSDGGNRAFGFGNATDVLVPADYTGDGKLDIAVWRPATGTWFVLRSEEVSYYSFPFGIPGDIPAAADYDGDGKADPAIFRPSTSTWYINLSAGGSQVIGFGSAGDAPAIGDYDGDGKADIAIWRAAVGEWWIRRSTNASVYAFQFGNSSDRPVQGDFTGDGKTDVAVFRPSTGEWYVLRSENNSYFSAPFGATGDTPVPGDYDGDGRADLAVFRPSGSTWYVNRSTAGLYVANFGAGGDRPVPSVFIP